MAVFRATLLLLLTPLWVSAVELTGVDLKLISDSNPAKAEFERDIESTGSARVRLTGNLLDHPMHQREDLRSGLSINASATFEHNLDLEDLGESRYRLSVDGFRENRQGRGIPFTRMGLGIGYADSQTERRDALVIDAGASINYQPASFFDTTLGVQLAVSDAQTEVFDTSKTTLFATANFSPAPRLVLRSGLRYVIGDEVSTATPTLNIVNNADVIEPDEAFGGADAQRFAYLIDADSLITEFGLGYSISGTVTLDLLYRFITTDAAGDIAYERNVIELTLGVDL